MSVGSIVYVGVAPHPPIMVPEVGGAEAERVRGSIEAMRELTGRVIASGAETVVIVSPHAPLDARAFVAYAGAELRGDFSRFRAPAAKVSALLDVELLDGIERAAADDGFRVERLDDHELDHGTAVPLYFLLRNGWRGRVVALGYSFLPDAEHVRFGAAVGRAADSSGRRVAFIASGDLSHRLTPDAPAGFNEQAHLFDEEIIECIRSREPERIARIDPGLRRLAGECGYRSLLVALGASAGPDAAGEVLHYEAPFGVGYLVAQLSRRENEREPAGGADELERVTVEQNFAAEKTSGENFPEDTGARLPAFARFAVETFVREGRAPKPDEFFRGEAPAALKLPAACFVSIKTDEGKLRGCIGTVEPAHGSLAEELIANAVGAASRDPRFQPVAASELARLRYSVDILSGPEPAEFTDLDPKLYGVIVEDDAGLRRGLLLPDIEGVETAAEQVEIAARKAGISAREPVSLQRFCVTRFRETFGHELTSE